MTKLREIAAEHVLDLAAIAETQTIISYGFAEHGAPLLLTTSANDAEVPCSRTGGANQPSFPVASTPRPYTAWIIDGRVRRTTLGEISVAFPSIQALPLGEVLVAGARCRPDERNGYVFSAEGIHSRAIQLGDGIESVQTTRSGEIWACYFDEGVFGNFGRGGTQEPIGSAGLVCFDSQGEITWRYQPPGGRDMVCDCYALNVAEDFVWAYYYAEFALARVDHDRHVTVWDTPVRGASAIAAHRDLVLLYGGYAEDRDAVWLGRLGSDSSTEIGRRHILGDRGRLRPQLVVGRGQFLISWRTAIGGVLISPSTSSDRTRTADHELSLCSAARFSDSDRHRSASARSAGDHEAMNADLSGSHHVASSTNDTATAFSTLSSPSRSPVSNTATMRDDSSRSPASNPLIAKSRTLATRTWRRTSSRSARCSSRIGTTSGAAASSNRTKSSSDSGTPTVLQGRPIRSPKPRQPGRFHRSATTVSG